MTDEDGDGVYTATVRARRRDEYKFTFDGGVDLQEMFEVGTAHQDKRRLHQPLGAS